MAKVFVSAIALWDQIPQLLSIAVSVESEEGKPISGLSKSSFTVGQIPSSGGGSWFKQKISDILSAESERGFYRLVLYKYTNNLNVSEDWKSRHAKSVLTVEVTIPRIRPAAKGRALVINMPTTTLP